MADEQTQTNELEQAEAVEQVEAVAEAVEEVAVEEAIESADSGATEAEVMEAEVEVGVESTEPAVAGKAVPEFRAGDTLRLGLRIKEGDKTRTQYFEGIVLARKGAGISQTFTIRKIGAGGIAVERIFPVFSPSIQSYEVRRRGVVRRAKIYFLRDIVGSTANVIKERKVAKEMQQVQEARAARKASKLERKAAKPAASTKKAVADKSATRSAKRASRKSS
jgi:large subunit ribosomal protein L19